jgi:hypothetical protein
MRTPNRSDDRALGCCMVSHPSTRYKRPCRSNRFQSESQPLTPASVFATDCPTPSERRHLAHEAAEASRSPGAATPGRRAALATRARRYSIARPFHAPGSLPDRAGPYWRAGTAVPCAVAPRDYGVVDPPLCRGILFPTLTSAPGYRRSSSRSARWRRGRSC